MQIMGCSFRKASQNRISLIFFPSNHSGISYTLQGDYYLPDLALSDEEEQSIGLWGQRHLRYIKQHRKVLYLNLLTSGKL